MSDANFKCPVIRPIESRQLQQYRLRTSLLSEAWSIPQTGGRRFEPGHAHQFSRSPRDGFLRQPGGILHPPYKFRCVKLKGTRTHGELLWNGLRFVLRVRPLFPKGGAPFKMTRIEETNQLGSWRTVAAPPPRFLNPDGHGRNPIWLT